MPSPLRTLLLLAAALPAFAGCADEGAPPSGDPGRKQGPSPAESAPAETAPAASAVEWDPMLIAPGEGEFVPPPGSGSVWIEGVVRDAAGAPVPGATVEMHAVPRGEAPGIPPLLHARTAAGPDGRFRVGPGPEPWQEKGILSAFAPGFARTSLRGSRITIEGLPHADEGKEAEIVLRPGITVRGDVEADDGRPLESPVTIWAVGDRNFHEVIVTDDAGAFSLVAPPGRLILSALAGDHAPARAEMEVTEDGENRVVVEVRRGRDLRGRVVDLRTGDPIPGAVIRALYGRTLIRFADGEGRFELPLYWFRAFQVRAPGYAERTHYLSAESGGPGSVPEIVRLAPGCVVRGRVVDPDARPVEGIRVRTLHPDARGNLVDVTGPTTAADGSFTFVGVPLPAPDGEVRIFAVADGFAFGASPALHPGPGEVVDGVVVVAPRLVDIRGTVRDEDGEPVEGTVRLHWEIPPGLDPYRDVIPSEGRTRVDADGRWEARVPERVRVRARAVSEGFEPGEVEARSPAHPASAARPADKRALPLDIEVFRGLSLRGRVLDADGNPVRFGDVRVEPHPPSDPRNSRDAEVRRDGTFEAGGLQPGLYDFSVVAPPRYLQEVVRKVEAGGPVVEVRLRRPAGIMGRVVLPEGAAEVPVIQVSLQALGETFPLSGRHDLRISGKDGRFSIGPLAPAPYRVTFTAGDWRREFDRVVVEDGTPADLGEVVLGPGGTVEGTVLAGGGPLAGARVEVFLPLPGGAARSEAVVVTGGDGRFRAGGLASGPHYLSVRPLDLPVREVPFTSTPGATAEVTVEVPEGGRAVVRVLDPAGVPSGGVRVLFTGERGGVAFWKEGSPDPGPHETGPDGILRCSGLPVGALRAFAEKAGVGSAEAPVDVAEGATVEVELRLRARER